MPAFTVPYRNGWQLAVEEINAAGGVLGRKLEVISRDDAGKPEDAVRLAGELVDNEKVDLLAGTLPLQYRPRGQPISRKQNKQLFVAAEPLTDALVWAQGNRYTLPPAALDLHAGGDAGRGGGEAAGASAGRPSRPTTSTASRR